MKINETNIALTAACALILVIVVYLIMCTQSVLGEYVYEDEEGITHTHRDCKKIKMVCDRVAIDSLFTRTDWKGEKITPAFCPCVTDEEYNELQRYKKTKKKRPY